MDEQALWVKRGTTIEVQDPGNNYTLNLPRQDSEVLKIFYSNEELLSYRNEYMANYLARLLTQPD